MIFTSMFAEFKVPVAVKAGCKGIHMLHSKMSRGAAKNQRVRFKVVLNVFLLCSNRKRYGLP
jgi:hypothetical protein